MADQDDVQVHFTVIETLRSTAIATISRAQFQKEMGIKFENATQEQVSEFCVASNIEYKKTSMEERVEDPVFIEILVRFPSKPTQEN